MSSISSPSSSPSSPFPPSLLSHLNRLLSLISIPLRFYSLPAFDPIEYFHFLTYSHSNLLIQYLNSHNFNINNNNTSNNNNNSNNTSNNINNNNNSNTTSSINEFHSFLLLFSRYILTHFPNSLITESHKFHEFLHYSLIENISKSLQYDSGSVRISDSIESARIFCLRSALHRGINSYASSPAAAAARSNPAVSARAPRYSIYCSSTPQTSGWIDRAALELQLDVDTFRLIPIRSDCVGPAAAADSNGESDGINALLSHRVDSGSLNSMIEADIENGRIPLCIIASLGSPFTEEIVFHSDEFTSLSSIAHRFSLWLHVEGSDINSIQFHNRNQISSAIFKLSRFISPRLSLNQSHSQSHSQFQPSSLYNPIIDSSLSICLFPSTKFGSPLGSIIPNSPEDFSSLFINWVAILQTIQADSMTSSASSSSSSLTISPLITQFDRSIRFAAQQTQSARSLLQQQSFVVQLILPQLPSNTPPPVTTQFFFQLCTKSHPGLFNLSVNQLNSILAVRIHQKLLLKSTNNKSNSSNNSTSNSTKSDSISILSLLYGSFISPSRFHSLTGFLFSSNILIPNELLLSLNSNENTTTNNTNNPNPTQSYYDRVSRLYRQCLEEFFIYANEFLSEFELTLAGRQELSHLLASEQEFSYVPIEEIHLEFAPHTISNSLAEHNHINTTVSSSSTVDDYQRLILGFGCIQFRPLQVSDKLSHLNEVNESLVRSLESYTAAIAETINGNNSLFQSKFPMKSIFQIIKTRKNYNNNNNNSNENNNNTNEIVDNNNNIGGESILAIRYSPVSLQLGLIPLLQLIKSTARKLQFPLSIIGELSETLKSGIREAEKKLIRSRPQPLVQSLTLMPVQFVRLLPLVGSLLNYWSPESSNPIDSDILEGQSFDIRSNSLSTIKYDKNNNGKLKSNGNNNYSVNNGSNESSKNNSINNNSTVVMNHRNSIIGNNNSSSLSLTIPSSSNSVNGIETTGISPTATGAGPLTNGGAVRIRHSSRAIQPPSPKTFTVLLAFPSIAANSFGPAIQRPLVDSLSSLNTGFQFRAFFPLSDSASVNANSSMNYSSAELFLFYEPYFNRNNTIPANASIEAELGSGPILAWCEVGQRYLAADQAIAIQQINTILLNSPPAGVNGINENSFLTILTPQIALHLEAPNTAARDLFVQLLLSYLQTIAVIEMRNLTEKPLESNELAGRASSPKPSNSTAISSSLSAVLSSSSTDYVTARRSLERGLNFVVFVLDRHDLSLTTRHEVLLWFRAGLKDGEKGSLAWCKRGGALEFSPSRSLSLDKMVQICMGKQTKAFQNAGAMEADAQRCFSILVEKMILNLEAPSAEERNNWLSQFHSVMTNAGKATKILNAESPTVESK